MENIGTYQSGYGPAEDMVNAAWLEDALDRHDGLDGRDGVVVERVSLDGLELVAIAFPEAA